ncbi:MAG: diguanylate cyclase [Pseudomonadota bacterium]
MPTSRFQHAARLGITSLLLLVCGARLPHAAEAPVWSSPSAVHFDVLTLADGLSDSTVYSVSRDSQGQMWFGLAAGGANRYDGYRVEAFLHDPATPSSLSHSAAGEVLATRSGAVLIGTWGGGLNRMLDADGRFERLNPEKPPQRIQVLFEDRESRIWVGSADDGLYRLENASGADLEPVFRPDGEGFGRVWSLTEDPSGRLWAATDRGLFDLRGTEVRPKNGWTGHPRAVLHDGESLWVADSQAVFRWQDDQLTVLQTGLPLINTLARSPSGDVLVGTLAGLVAFDADGQRVAPFGRAELSLFPDRNIRRVYFDETGVGWIATREAGVILALPTAQGFDGFSLDSRLDTADTLIELDVDDVLIGSRRGLWRLRKAQGSSPLEQIPGSEGLSINRLARTEDGVLLGTYDGLLSFDPVSGLLSSTPEFAAVKGMMVTAVNVAPDGTTDVGTFTDGLFRFRPDGEVEQLVRSGVNPIPGVAVSDIEVDSLGRTWLGLWDAGIAMIDQQGAISSFERDSLAIEGLIHDLLPTDEALWVATSFGLSRFDPVTGESLSVNLIREFPNTAVQRLAEGAGRIWAGTTRGVVAIDPASLDVTRFTTADGLTVEEFFARAGYVGKSNRVYFGGLGGFVSFLPDQVLLNPQPPRLAITRAWIDGQPVSTQQPMVLTPGQSTVRVRYLASDFRNPSANRFRWRLLGDDDDWSEATGAPETLLTGLAPGDYRFELQGANANGIWNRESTVLPIVVQPAWWQTLPGRATAVGALLLTVFLLSFWNTQRIRGRNRVLTAEVERQTRALREANHSLAKSAATDHLTKLANRRGFLKQVESEAADSQRYFALLDADNFKQVNDLHGHEVGDNVLRHVADVLRDASPANALVARWGGEEFVIQFRATDMEAAHEAMEQVRLAVLHRQPGGNLAETPVSITIGLAQTAPGEPPMHTINRADACLLAGKDSGKNRVFSIPGSA